MQIVHLDADLIVVNKPSGLLSVPGRGADKQDCVVREVGRQRRGRARRAGHRERCRCGHGLLLLARGPTQQRALSMAFEARQVHKRYVAVVSGLMAGDPQRWQQVDLPLLTDWPNRPRQKIDHLDGKPSLTRWRVLSRDEHADRTRVELEPLTGRTHQLRVHMLALGHPIIGDALYGPTPEHGVERLLLHARHLSLPELGLSLECPPDF